MALSLWKSRGQIAARCYSSFLLSQYGKMKLATWSLIIGFLCREELSCIHAFWRLLNIWLLHISLSSILPSAPWVSSYSHFLPPFPTCAFPQCKLSSCRSIRPGRLKLIYLTSPPWKSRYPFEFTIPCFWESLLGQALGAEEQVQSWSPSVGSPRVSCQPHTQQQEQDSNPAFYKPQ